MNIFDAAMLTSHWGEAGAPYDITNDGIVNIFDASVLTANWGDWTSSTGTFSADPPTGVQAQSGGGPTIGIGETSEGSNRVRVEVDATGIGEIPAAGVNIHVRWDPSIFAFVGHDTSNTPFSSDGFCINATPDLDGGGVVFSCGVFAGGEVTSDTRLVTILLEPLSGGCSRLHLVTFGAPDNADSFQGSLSVDDAAFQPQDNAYVQGVTSDDGATCQPPECVNADSDSMCNEIDFDRDGDGAWNADEELTGNPVGNALGSDPDDPASVPEVCDGLDNDLNEGIDEGFDDNDLDSAADCVDEDDDNDGMGDALEIMFACLDPLTADASDDPDDDGHSSGSELQGGSYPCSADSPSATPTLTPTPTPAPTPTLTPTPTGQTPTATSTPTGTPPAGESVVWGDNNCSGEANPVDSLLTLRFDAGLGTNTGDCPDLGQAVDVQNASPHLWGDVDCGGDITPVDSLKLLRYDAGLSVSQGVGCPLIGADVSIIPAALPST